MIKKPNISDLRHQVVIEKMTKTADGYGGFSVTWSQHMVVWANIVPASAKEIFFAEKLQHNVTHKIIIRYFEGLSSDMRIKFGERIFEIHQILNPEERNFYLMLLCEEGAGT